MFVPFVPLSTVPGQEDLVQVSLQQPEQEREPVHIIENRKWKPASILPRPALGDLLSPGRAPIVKVSQPPTTVPPDGDQAFHT